MVYVLSMGRSPDRDQGPGPVPGPGLRKARKVIVHCTHFHHHLLSKEVQNKRSARFFFAVFVYLVDVSCRFPVEQLNQCLAYRIEGKYCHKCIENNAACWFKIELKESSLTMQSSR